MKRFDHKDSLIQAMKTGLNLFVGAGFSLYARDAENNKLPTGSQLVKELQEKVGGGLTDLAKYCSVMERKRKSELYAYLTKRFHVASFDDFYLNLNYLNLKGVYTTNIDDLIPQIISKSESRYVNEQSVYGDCTNEQGVNYLPLHGYVKYPEQGYVFSVEKIANIYNQAPKIWAYLSSAVEKYPTLFIGYGMNDTGVIESILSQQTFQNAQKNMWIVLHNPSDDDIEYFEGIGFSIIISETKEFLDEIPLLDSWSATKIRKSPIETLLSKNLVPKDARGQTQRPIEEFYRGMAPSWPDILRNVIHKTSFFKDIENSIFSSRHTLVIGSPISGKTTLAMQVAHQIQFDGVKLIFDSLSLNRAEYIAKLVGNERALIVVENFSDDVDAILLLAKLSNTKVLGVDRGHNYAIISHKIDERQFDVINVTELKEQDIQGIVNAIPESIRCSEAEIKKKKKSDAEDSVFEFVIRHVKGQSIENRYKDFIRQLEKEDPDLIEFLVLCAYMHRSRVPLSMEVAYQYFSDKSYKEVIAMRKQLADFLQEDDDEWLAENNIDGYRPRTSIIADAILKYTNRRVLADVMWNLVDNVCNVCICDYRTFRKWAFDKSLVLRAFPNWKDGQDFYEEVFLYDNRNPYVLQQGALYLSAMHKYEEAFDWIDRAKTMTDDRHFSIRNSHAIILFDANYEVESMDAEQQLQRSMKILHKCYKDDQRRTFHAKVYADQALRYFRKYHDDQAVAYLTQAQAWLTDELDKNGWDYEIRPLLKRVIETLEHKDA